MGDALFLMKKERIDKLLVDRGLALSRTKAQALVMAGLVLVDEQRVEKASETFPPDSNIRLKGDTPESRFVSRGGLKLEAALNHFQIDVTGLRCLDVGASTGGFTDCLLKNGAFRVVAIDVGHSQMDWALRSDERVEVVEGVNARYLKREDWGEFDLIVMDVSFISVTKIWPSLIELLTTGGRMVTLIKPQFEVGRGEVGRGGIVTDSFKHERVIEDLKKFATDLKLTVVGVIDSPILGASGNKEFLLLCEK
jgi:23S rRNA (cytidine1920-2'-O)/16S rRNA (cytidine1409-2'-O)-methyltransferase